MEYAIHHGETTIAPGEQKCTVRLFEVRLKEPNRYANIDWYFFQRARCPEVAAATFRKQPNIFAGSMWRCRGQGLSEERKPQAACNRLGLLDHASRRRVKRGCDRFYRIVPRKLTLMRLIEQCPHRCHERVIIQCDQRFNNAMLIFNQRQNDCR
ncbi:hypothetical protein [Ralstonia edaphi]|uniref:hypothetical protein n=1 Tax=Ralstonia edaphi TaxID=3058599 RepID=UPI00292D7547|nr:hypothetical protein [Ralstonia sp. LMG 6871]